MELTAEKLRAELFYDPDTGKFTWLGKRRNTAALRRDAGSVRSDGYIDIHVAGRRYRAHRLAWLYVHGSWPVNNLDHIDGDPANNRISNLRDVPHRWNAQNTKKPTGIEFRPNNPLKYRVRVWVDDRAKTVGSFATLAEAEIAREAAKQALHPGHVPLG